MAAAELARPERPATTYDEALARFDALLARDTDVVDPASRSRLLSTGRRAERAIVFFHGLTNSPQQWLALSERFTARGYNVLIPRLPYHGHADLMTTDLARLTEHELLDATAEALDVAAGLGERVSVAGLSMGGVLAVWAAQFRPVAVAAPIAPAIGLRVLPYALTCPAFRLVQRLPNRFLWWDPRYKARLPGPPYAYPRFPTHALAATQRLALELVAAARRAPPRAGEVWVVTNGADLAVNNAASALLVKAWQAAGADNVRTFQFPTRLKLFHDVVDPLQPYQNVALTHPVLEQIIADGTPPDLASLK
jgi:pimeloyl-ACP methyl ester carboxylesterase